MVAAIAKKNTKSSTHTRIGRFTFLLISIALMLGVRPFLESFMAVAILMDILFTLLLLSGVYAFLYKKMLFYIVLIIAIPAIAVHWFGSFTIISSDLILGEALASVFYTLLVILILRYLFTEKQITVDVIAGAVCAYLLIGLMWASFYILLESVEPNSFKVAEFLVNDDSIFLYYSYVTLTTLGYGDITPITDQARSLTILESTIGPVYLAILVAKLVSVHVLQSKIDD